MKMKPPSQLCLGYPKKGGVQGVGEEKGEGRRVTSGGEGQRRGRGYGWSVEWGEGGVKIAQSLCRRQTS